MSLIKLERKRISPLVTLIMASIVLTSISINVPKAQTFPDTIYSDTSDGWLRATDVYDTDTKLHVGDEGSNNHMQSFVRFSLTGISGTLASARLYLYLDHSYYDNTPDLSPSFSNPGLGDCMVRHINDFTPLDPLDMDAPTIGNDPGVLISSTATPNRGYVSIDIKAAMQDDISNMRSYTAFVIKLSTNTDSDSMQDFWAFSSADESGTEQDPYIEYTLAMPDFQIDASPDSLTVSQGSSDSSTITITSLNGFSSSVDLSYSWFGDVPSDITINLPGPVTPPVDGSSTSTLQVSAGSTATIGTFTLRVTGSSGETSHDLDISIEIIATTTTPPPTPPPSGCIIATAIYGGEMFPQVLYMRHVRDNMIGSSQIGKFMVTGWNGFYYSWSPPLAKLISAHALLKPIFRILLLPLVSTVHMTAIIYAASAYINPGLASITAFLFAALLSTIIYIAIPITALFYLFRKKIANVIARTITNV